jgi:hypothetical protein
MIEKVVLNLYAMLLAQRNELMMVRTTLIERGIMPSLAESDVQALSDAAAEDVSEVLAELGLSDDPRFADLAERVGLYQSAIHSFSPAPR